MTHKSTMKITVGLAATVAIFLIFTPLARTHNVYSPPSFATAQAILLEGYRAAPALMLVLALAIAVLMLVAAIAAARTMSQITRSAVVPSEIRDDTNEPGDVEPFRSGPQLPYLDVQIGNRGARCALFGEMLRIGREDDNDIRIPSDAVARYHAAIHREDDDDWHITEIAGTSGKGLIVNGRPCGEARLHDGDVIQLGPGRLRFHAAYA